MRILCFDCVYSWFNFKFMSTISLKNKVSTSSNVLVITTKFENEFGLPDKVNNYIVERLKEKKGSNDKKASKPEKETCLNYNYIGKYVSILVVDSEKDKTKLYEQIRRHGALVAEAINAAKGSEVFVYNQTKLPQLSLAAAEGIALGNYQFIRHKSNAKKQINTLQNIIIANSGLPQESISELNAVIKATLRARDLVNEPVNKLNASGLANAFKQMGKDAGFKVQVLGKREISNLKMGGLLSVNQGSVDEPTFSIMEYKPKKARNKKPIVLVGKGVVYDTGGLSLKPTPNSMDSMKCDMAGGAAVGAVLYAVAKAKLNVHVIGLVPATDNRPGFNAFAPGDIVTMMDGSTVEMLNSDAEGRMILADALHYAKRYQPEITIDVATLTGSAVAAIGTFAVVGMGNADNKFKEKLIASGQNSFERIADFPFWDEYNDLLKSDIADQKNIGGAHAGSITAGKFLEKFTDYPYYHLDIAGPAFLAAKDGYRPKGATGVGVRLLFDFIKNL
jgi:leucyl aminopeptidase